MAVLNPMFAATIVPWWVALIVSLIIAGIAWRTHHLSRDGAMAAVCVGTTVLHAQLSWGAVLISWFVATSLLSRWKRERKWARTAPILAKTDTRDASQVVANGGVFALLALTLIVRRAFDDGAFGPLEVAIAVAAAGALAAAAADTFATEVGTLVSGAPRSIRGWHPVPAGTSGAITLRGTIASIIGALFVAIFASAVGMTPIATIPAIVIAGFLGALFDTVLGAWAQERRWCPQCETTTERLRHDCDTLTVSHFGISWLNNDVVNMLCTMSGAVIAVCVWR